MILNLSYKMDIKSNSKDSKTVIESWGLQKEKEHKICDISLNIEDNKIYYFCGYSGSGKSSILRAINENIPIAIFIENYKDFLKAFIKDKDKLMIDYFTEFDYNIRLKILGKCGLTEVWKYITKISDLSDGEKFRFMLYCQVMRILLNNQGTIPGKYAVLIIDEFCSTLDRVTAKIVSQNIHKLRDFLNKEGIIVTFILASAHEDLIPYLKADYNYFKEFQPVLKTI